MTPRARASICRHRLAPTCTAHTPHTLYTLIHDIQRLKWGSIEIHFRLKVFSIWVYYKATIIQISWTLNESRQLDVLIPSLDKDETLRRLNEIFSTYDILDAVYLYVINVMYLSSRERWLTANLLSLLLTQQK